MKPFPGKPSVSILAASALAGILVLLAFLQFEWVNKVAQAERDRMETSLETAIIRFRWDFYTQLLHVCSAFQVEHGDLSKQTLQSYADRYDDWMHASTRPRLVASLYVWKARNPAGHRLFRLDPATAKFEPADWPPEFESLRLPLRRHPARFFHHIGPHQAYRHWNLVEQVPALVRVFRSSRQTPLAGREPASPEGYAIIELNLKYIQTALFPLLAERYFRGPRGLVYRVSIVSRRNPGRVIYQSIPMHGMNSGYPPDAVVDLISVRHPGFMESPFADRMAARSDVNRGNGPLASLARRQVENGVAPLLVLAGQKADWQMVVRHRSGSVQAATVELRHRDLAVSLGVLVILAAGMALIVISAQRAQRLARIQMDFVAGISHELRTPLAVICSAAENLADGVVSAGDQVKEYGSLIRNEGRHLAEMVEQTLGFAAQQAVRHSGEGALVDVAAAIDAALIQAGLMIGSSNVQVERRIEPGLPPIMGDAPALIRCLQNLLVNAVKYGGESRWVRVSARAAHARKRPEVQIVVEDKGIGIGPGDLPHIFEPFYRGRSREVAQIRGTGLGLSLARDIAEGMGGVLSIKSQLGKGSSFILRLPIPAVTGNAITSEALSPRMDGCEPAKR
jgi:signal transduction histidine kinase